MCTDGHGEVVRLLLEAGANANVHNSLFVTPLHLAALGEFTAYQTLAATVDITGAVITDL